MGRGTLGVAAVLAALVWAPAAEAASLATGPGQRPGPDVLYAPPARAPQLESTGIWQAPPILVSGATAYRRGEFLYQDFLYDDHGARIRADPEDERSSKQSFSAVNGTYTYPSDKAKYANNAADLVEVRVRPLADAIAFRLTFNTMLAPEHVATTLGLGEGPASVPAPFGANVRMPAQVFVTVHGDRADARTAAGVPLPAPAVAIDRERRQVEVRVPRAAWDPGTGQARIAAATGLWDPATGAYLVPKASRTATTPGGAGPSPAAPAFFNVAFRLDEPLPQITDPAQPFGDPRWWRDRNQARALADGDLTEYGITVDFGKLAAGTDDDSGVPRTGALNRILASAHEPSQGVDFAEACGTAERCEGAYQGRLQPYSLYVPAKPAPAQGHGLTLLLHSLGANHNQYSGSRNQSQLGERTSGHLVVTPLGRGPDGWYYDLAEADTFEVWADVARHYPLDPERVALTGYSMGGYGTYKLGSRYPDLFGAANTTVGPPTLGLSADGRQSTGGPQTSTLPQLEGFRHIPVIVWAGTTDQLVPFTSVVAQVQQLDRLGYRYVFDAFTPADHFALAVNDQYAPVAELLGDARVVRDPAHVSYTVNPTMDFPAAGVVADHAYWLSGVTVRDRARTRGTIDVRSQGFGVTDPQPGPTQSGGGTLTGGSFQAGPTYVRRSKAWGAPGTEPRADRLVITARNVRAVTVDPRRAKVTCRAALDVDTDGPLTVTLAGCDRSVAATPRPAARSCAPANAFTRARVLPRGRRLRIDAARPGGRPFTVDVFRQSAGRLVLGERRVARYTARTRAFTATLPRSAGDGTYLVRLTARLATGRTDSRRVVLRRSGGRFRSAPPSYRRDSCGLLSSFKLERPVFGGTRLARSLGISFRVARQSRVRVTVSRGGRVVRRFGPSTRRARQTHRLNLSPRRLRRGLYTITVEVRPTSGGAPLRASLRALKL